MRGCATPQRRPIGAATPQQVAGGQQERSGQKLPHQCMRKVQSEEESLGACMLAGRVRIAQRCPGAEQGRRQQLGGTQWPDAGAPHGGEAGVRNEPLTRGHTGGAGKWASRSGLAGSAR
jgi:hypothetical protein